MITAGRKEHIFSTGLSWHRDQGNAQFGFLGLLLTCWLWLTDPVKEEEEESHREENFVFNICQGTYRLF